MKSATFNFKYIAGGVVIAALAVFLIVRGVSSATMPYLKVQEVAAQEGKFQGHLVRVDAQVKPGTINWDTTKNELRFSVIDKTNPEGPSLAVIYHDLKPDPFNDQTQVIADGTLNGTTLQATQLITRCPSKYEAAQSEADKGSNAGAGK